MKVIISVAVLGSAVSPATSFRYLESLNEANPVMSHAPVESNGSSYSDALAAKGCNTPTRAGMRSYLESVPQNPAIGGGAGLTTYLNSMSEISPLTDVSISTATSASTSFDAAPSSTGIQSYLESVPKNAAVGGPGMISYLNTVPQNPVVSGAGMTSYLDTMSGSTPATQAYTAATPQASTPPSAAAAPAFTSATPSGSGILSYLDSVPKNPSVGGPCITSYLDSVPQNPAVSGAGMTSYLGSMAGATTAASSVEAYIPPSAATPAPAAPAAAFTSSAPSGSGMSSYLDTVPKNPSVGGAGITSHLDSIPQNPAVNGAGITSYVDSIFGSAAAAQAYTAAAPQVSSPPPASAAASLAFKASAPSGSGISSYLDSVPSNPSVRGAGITSYLDSVPQNPAVGGAGMTSYLDSTSIATLATVSVEAYTPASTVPESSTGSVPASSGSGISSYLDTIPSKSATGGPGMTSFLDTLPTNAVGKSGSGMNSYSENLKGGQPEIADSPFGSAVGTRRGSKISFTLEAENLAELIEQLQGKGGTIRLTGSLDSISFN